MRKTGWTPFLVLLIAFSFLGSSGAWAGDGHHRAKMEGTWFCNTFVAPGFGINETQILLTAGPRGTINTSETDDLTGFNPTLASQGFQVQTAGVGGWRKARGRAFDLNYLQLGFIGVGEDAGLLFALSRFRCAVEVRGDAMKGACDIDLWFADDPDEDGIPNAPNPVTNEPHLSFSDTGEMACNRIPVVPKN